MRELRSDTRSDEGVSLIEVLVAVVIIGVTFASILGAISTAIIGSSIDRSQVKVETELRSFAEFVKGQGYIAPSTSSYCNLLGAEYGSGYVSSQGGVTATVTNVGFWVDSNSATFDTFDTPPAGCTSDTGLHAVTLKATTSDPPATETVQIFVRDDAP